MGHLKIYQYIIFKTLSVQYYENKMQFHNFVDGKKEFIKPKWFERMTCGGLLGLQVPISVRC